MHVVHFFALASVCATWKDCYWLLFGIHSHHHEDVFLKLFDLDTIYVRHYVFCCQKYVLHAACISNCKWCFCLNIHQTDLCHWWLVGLFWTAWKGETGQFPSFRVLFSDHKFHQISTLLPSWLWKCLTSIEAISRKPYVNLYNWDLSISSLSVTLLNAFY